jgi:hypothetical protein
MLNENLMDEAPQSDAASRAEQRTSEEGGLMGCIRFCDILSRWVQPPDAENRTSDRVGEVMGTIRYPDPIGPCSSSFL